MLLETWGGRFAFTVCGVLLLIMGLWAVLRPTDIPLNIIDPSVSPTLDIINQVCTVVIGLAFAGAGCLMLWTVVYSIRMAWTTVDDTPREPITVRRIALQVLIVLGILVAMLAGALVLDYWLQQ